jgi:hypothetical protein
MSFINMYIQDTTNPSIKQENSILIKKKLVYVGLVLGISILIGFVLVTHYITKINVEIKPNCSAKLNPNKILDHDCKKIVCNNSAIFNGK